MISAVVPDELGAALEEVRDDDPDLASYLPIEERELEAGGLNQPERGTRPARFIAAQATAAAFGVALDREVIQVGRPVRALDRRGCWEPGRAALPARAQAVKRA
jgi:hypothetical protein